jgi:hypothetical protein
VLAADRIDTTFDVRSDTPPGKDPDQLSPTLRRYHQILWSKPLPSGEPFALVTTKRGAYLHHQSHLGEFSLASDSVVPSFRYEDVFRQQPAERAERFLQLSYTIGGMMVFPGHRVGRAMTLNGARGFHPRIKDRFDLTVECIRRHYLGEESPLADVLARYAAFFELFGSFDGYVDFFLLQDLVTENRAAVRFFTPWDGFQTRPIPQTLEEYVVYRDRAEAFLHARNARIERWQGAT